MSSDLEPPRGAVEGTTNCLQCAGMFKNAQEKKKTDDSVVLPFVNPAITWVPDWQQKIIMGQMIMQCVVVPICLEHMEVAEKSAEQKAMEGGILLGQAGG